MTPRKLTTVMEIDGKEYDVPTAYICPISLDVMNHPLVTRSGHRFECEAIQAWLVEERTNPMTREVMGPRDLIPDYRLEDEIRFWKASQGILTSQYPYRDEVRRHNYEGFLFTAVIDEKTHAKRRSELASEISPPSSYTIPRLRNPRNPRRFMMPRWGKCIDINRK